jgi:aspartate kinase
MVVVTSALAGVTNLLLESATKAAQGDVRLYIQAAHQFASMHNEVIQALLPNPTHQSQVRQEISQLINEFTNLCHAIQMLGETTPRAMDAIAALGGRMSVRLLSAILQTQGVPAPYVEATRLIVTDDQFMDAHPDLEATSRLTHQVLEPLLSNGQVPVVTGFIGASPAGITTTLGRGGSDYSASLLGAVLPATEVWIWTDVDGVMSADPRMVPEACSVYELSYREVAELAYFGAKVLHPKTIRPVIEAGIGLRVRNTFNPSHPGTNIVADRDVHGTSKVRPSP